MRLHISRRRAQALTVIAVFLAVVIIDQAIKIWVKTHMCLHESIRVTDWFYILFTENNGMAFGMELFDKIFLTLGRILLTGAVAWYIARCIRDGIKWGLLVCLALIMAGAMGNIVDCLFYGLIFNNPPHPYTAQLVPWGMGYGEFLYGRVVDMFYFPLIEWDMPSWVPVYGGEHCIFFSPVFNFADAAISCGIVALLLFYRKNINNANQ